MTLVWTMLVIGCALIAWAFYVLGRHYERKVVVAWLWELPPRQNSTTLAQAIEKAEHRG